MDLLAIVNQLHFTCFLLDLGVLFIAEGVLGTVTALGVESLGVPCLSRMRLLHSESGCMDLWR